MTQIMTKDRIPVLIGFITTGIKTNRLKISIYIYSKILPNANLGLKEVKLSLETSFRLKIIFSTIFTVYLIKTQATHKYVQIQAIQGLDRKTLIITLFARLLDLTDLATTSNQINQLCTLLISITIKMMVTRRMSKLWKLQDSKTLLI